MLCTLNELVVLLTIMHIVDPHLSLISTTDAMCVFVAVTFAVQPAVLASAALHHQRRQGVWGKNRKLHCFLGGTGEHHLQAIIPFNEVPKSLLRSCYHFTYRQEVTPCMVNVRSTFFP